MFVSAPGEGSGCIVGAAMRLRVVLPHWGMSRCSICNACFSGMLVAMEVRKTWLATGVLRLCRCALAGERFCESQRQKECSHELYYAPLRVSHSGVLLYDSLECDVCRPAESHGMSFLCTSWPLVSPAILA